MYWLKIVFFDNCKILFLAVTQQLACLRVRLVCFSFWLHEPFIRSQFICRTHFTFSAAVIRSIAKLPFFPWTVTPWWRASPDDCLKSPRTCLSAMVQKSWASSVWPNTANTSLTQRNWPSSGLNQQDRQVPIPGPALDRDTLRTHFRRLGLVLLVLTPDLEILTCAILPDQDRATLTSVNQD